MLEYDRKKLGQHLRDIRERANFTQAEIASRLGYTSAQFISNIERGISVAPLPLLAKITKLCKSKPDMLTEIIMASQKQLLLQKFKIQKSRI